MTYVTASIVMIEDTGEEIPGKTECWESTEKCLGLEHSKVPLRSWSLAHKRSKKIERKDRHGRHFGRAEAGSKDQAEGMKP
jgi:hypothetical protein